MIIYDHDHKDRIVLELEENEFTLLAYLLEKSHQNLKDKMKDSLSTTMHKDIQHYFDQ